MKNYLEAIDKVLAEGVEKPNRTGINTKFFLGWLFRHNMKKGFPLLTTKKMAFKSIKVELEFFIKGFTDKNWLQERGCHIWDEWSSPNPNKKANDLGPIYGAQWRNFSCNHEVDGSTKGVDQLKQVIDKLKKNPYDRQLIVTAWNPLQIADMALPPCHVLFHLIANAGYLNLTWFQRSADLMLGVPFDIASYGLLLHLIARETNLKEGELIGMFNDVHIYENHIEGAKLQLTRSPKKLPKLLTHGNNNIFEWDHTKSKLENYQPDEKIKFDVAI